MPRQIFSLFSVFLILTFSASSFAWTSGGITIAVEPRPASVQLIDQELEDALDHYLNIVDAGERRAELERIMQQIDRAAAPSTYVRAETYVFFEYLQIRDLDAAEAHLQSFISFVRQFPYADTVVEYYVAWLELRSFQGQASEALALAEQLVDLIDQVENPRIGYYSHNILLGTFAANGQLERSLEHGVKALEWLSKTDDNRTARRRLSLSWQITLIHTELRNYDTAWDYVSQAIREAEYHGLQAFRVDLLFHRGYLEGMLGRNDESIATYEETIVLAQEMELHGLVLTSMNNLASSYIQFEDYARARPILEETYDLLVEQGLTSQDRTLAHIVMFNLALIDIMEGNFAAAENIKLHTDILRDLSPEHQFYDHLNWVARAYAAAGMYQEQAETLIEQRELGDTLSKREREEALRELQVRYQAQDQLQQIELLEQRNNLQQQVIANKQLQQQVFILFGVVVVLGLVLLGFLYRAARRANLRLKVANKQLEFHSRRDPLTALLNRRALQDHMTHRAKNERRKPKSEHPDGLVLLDVDYFKRINDTFGHAAGDTVLKALSERLTNLARSTDLVVRWGGEEFLLYLPGMAIDKLPEFTNRVLQVIGEKPVLHEGKEIPVTATAGFIHLPFAGIDESVLGWERALQIADMALYIGKVHGRNRAYGLRGLNKPYEEIKDQLENDLNAAIEEGTVEYLLIEGPAQQRRDDS